MYYARIKNGTVVNIVYVADSILLSAMSGGDTMISIEKPEDAPRIGWVYDGSRFKIPKKVAA